VFIIVFTKSPHWSLSSARWMQSTTQSNITKVYPIIIFLSMFRYSQWSIYFMFSYQNSVCTHIASECLIKQNCPTFHNSTPQHLLWNTFSYVLPVISETLFHTYKQSKARLQFRIFYPKRPDYETIICRICNYLAVSRRKLSCENYTSMKLFTGFLENLLQLNSKFWNTRQKKGNKCILISLFKCTHIFLGQNCLDLIITMTYRT
jgi:hypothetical protein